MSTLPPKKPEPVEYALTTEQVNLIQQAAGRVDCSHYAPNWHSIGGTFVSLYGPSENGRYLGWVGEARCNPKDQYVRKVGFRLALKRAVEKALSGAKPDLTGFPAIRARAYRDSDGPVAE